MKEFGKVIEYDGYYGKITNQDGKEYTLFDKEIMNNEQLDKYDIVSYVPESYSNDEVEENIARFVKKIEKKR